MTRRFVVHGRVQGVGFRDFVKRAARKLELSGWVRNRHDGTVEVEAIGEAHALDQLEIELSNGPPASRVSRVDRRELSQSGWQGEGFEIVR